MTSPNADRGSKERIAQIYACAGANRIKVEEMVAGDIGCTVKLKDVHTGNTLNGKALKTVSTSLNIRIPNIPAHQAAE